MIRFIKGIFHPTPGGDVIIETASGLGLAVTIPANASLYKYAEGEQVKVYTSMVVKEDDVSLYGFADRESLELFELLTTVNGVGAKAGMAIMSALPPSELKRAILMGDAAAIATANGVGKKIAERVILELKEKVGKLEGLGDAGGAADETFVPAGNARGEAVAALQALGYTRQEAATAVNRVKDEDLSCEDYIKFALKQLF